MRSFLLTGTDTGVGKTTVGSAIAAALRLRGLRVGVAKPFETGCVPDADGNLIPADACRLRYFSECSEPLETICPVRCRDPLAPAVALRREGLNVNLELLRLAVTGIAERHDVTLVEGAGGLLVPIADRLTFADLANQWRLPLLIVVGNRLGALNHAQLTVRCAEQMGLGIAGYVVNQLAAEDDLAAQTNSATLAELIGPSVGCLPWLGTIEQKPEERRRLALVAEEHLQIDRLLNSKA